MRGVGKRDALVTVCLGVFFAGVYLRSGNLIAPIIAHALMDITGLTNPTLIGPKVAAVVSQTPSSLEFILIILLSIIILAFGLYYIRKEKWDDIDKTWEEFIIE